MTKKYLTKNLSRSLSTALLVFAGLSALPVLAETVPVEDESRVRPLEDIAAYEAREKMNANSSTVKGAVLGDVRPNISEDFITYLYLQTEDTVFHLRWHSLTHVSSLFVEFDEDGNFINRVSAWDGRSSYLKAGGAAEASGTKVIMTVNSFQDDVGEAIEQVMTTPAKRTTLVNNIVNALQADVGGYNGGVNFDLEFSWGSNVRNGIVLFLQELRTAMDVAGLQDKEISIYTNPTLNTDQWDIAGMEPNLDYLLYSGYTFAGSTTVNAVGDHASMTGSDTRIPGYLEQGLPPEKLVITLPAYGRRYTGTTTYGGSGTRGGAVGFTDGLYETTISTANSGPQTNNYQQGDESAWYTYNNGVDDVTAIWEGIEGINYKIRHALAVQDPTGGLNFDGTQLRGVGYWSSLWLAETSSYDPRTSSSVSRTRTYPHISQTLQEALAPAGTTQFFAERWEGYDFRWRDPDRALDTTGDTNNDSSWDVVVSPAGAGSPPSTNNAARVIFDLESGSSNTGIFAHEVLNSNIVPSATDYHATLANFDRSTKLQAYVYTPSALAGQTVRMLVLDGNLELEASSAFTLNSTGWQTIDFDLTNAGSVSGFTTAEPNFSSGDGVIDSASSTSRDIGFYGFAVQGAGIGAHTVYFDELTYEEAFPDAGTYTINEFRYDGSTGEFVEIHGPAGALPAGLQLRVISGLDGTATVKPISGSIDGSGLFVFGDSNVPNVDSSTGFNTGVDDLLNSNPSGIQLYDSVSGTVYDSVVYEAFSGIDDLIRLETLGVADEGYPWLGRAANGMDNSGAVYATGRYPDGSDSNINADDFSSMVATPGALNGDDVSGDSYSFDTAPSNAFQTFQTFSVGASGIGASPSGGNVHRCIDTTGGGAMSFIGDKALDAASGQVRITGEIYIPGAAEPAQAIGVGVCGTQGSTFFSGFPASNGYENGYWLIYENQAGIGLNDGRADHAGVFEFVHATNDNMDLSPTELLSSTAIGSTGATQGAWTTFEFIVDANASPSAQLIAIIGGTTVYSGAIPEGGPTSGAFQTGFRENHSGSPAGNEGTWIDNIQINPSASVDSWLVINQ